MAKKSPAAKYRNFATIVYPESAPDDWLEVIDSFHIPAIVSPLHKDDVNPDGTTKKPHYHVMLLFSSPRTLPSALEITKEIGGVGCIVVKELRGHARYFCHLDNPEKAQYSPSDVKTLCGVDYDDLISLPSDDYALVGEMIDFIEANDYRMYADFLLYCRAQRPDWFKCIIKSQRENIYRFICSYAHRMERFEIGKYQGPKDLPKFDPETGEVID